MDSALQDATREARRKPLAPPEALGRFCDYVYALHVACQEQAVFEQDTNIGRRCFCEPHSEARALEEFGTASLPQSPESPSGVDSPSGRDARAGGVRKVRGVPRELVDGAA